MMPNKDDMFSSANIMYLKNLNSVNSEDINTHIKEIFIRCS